MSTQTDSPSASIMTVIITYGVGGDLPELKGVGSDLLPLRIISEKDMCSKQINPSNFQRDPQYAIMPILVISIKQ